MRAVVINKKIEERCEQIKNNKHIVYGLRENTLYLKIIPKTTKHWENRR